VSFCARCARDRRKTGNQYVRSTTDRWPRCVLSRRSCQAAARQLDHGRRFVDRARPRPKIAIVTSATPPSATPVARPRISRNASPSLCCRLGVLPLLGSLTRSDQKWHDDRTRPSGTSRATRNARRSCSSARPPRRSRVVAGLQIAGPILRRSSGHASASRCRKRPFAPIRYGDESESR